MKIVAQLIWKDILLCRWAFIALVVYYVTYVVLNWGLFNFAGGLSQTHEVTQFYLGIGPVLSVLVVCLIGMQDPVSSSDAFHQTRPISKEKLFAAKAILCGLVAIVVPGFAQLVLAVSYGVALWVVCAQVVLSGLPLFFALALSSTAVSPTQLIRLGAVLLVLVVFPFLLAMNVRGNGVAYESIGELWSGPTRSLLNAIFMSVCAVAICSFQYLKRRSLVSIGLATVSIVIIQFVFSGNRVRMSLIGPAYRVEVPSDLSFIPNEGRTKTKLYEGTSRTEFREVSVFKAIVDDADLDGDQLYPVMLKGRLEVNGNVFVPSYDRRIYRSARKKREWDHFARSLGGIEFLNLPSSGPRTFGLGASTRRFTFMDIDASRLGAKLPVEGRYSGTIAVFRLRSVPVLSLPLTDSIEQVENHYFGRIHDLVIYEDRLRFSAIVGYVGWPIDAASPSWQRFHPIAESNSIEPAGGVRGMLILLVNRKRGEALIPNALLGDEKSPNFIVENIRSEYRTVTSYDVLCEFPDQVDRAWVEDAEIVVVDQHVVGAREIEIEIDNLRVF